MSVQMICPYCKKEFPFDNGKLDAEISKNKLRISEIHQRLSEIKFLPHTNETWKERRRLTLELKKLNTRASELKSFRKNTDQQIRHYEYEVFKDLVREKYGDKAFFELIDKVEDEIKAYKISGLMRHEYTRSNAKSNVTNINKL